ncbi:BTB/POZ and TAZ domain-containing protein 1 isoform X2 [Ananas comosus]|uniref:BTB/POZ and TAZ domain-containing protein 1 isoform X2 n=1 Tax=Ananas comosus TaxID=4615 RepID=A0A6P5FGM9_ANACO|nr:BTB/POZ and TAZ domain-containing protein 1 isoform X2 [Ananas comosus]
MDAKGGRVQNGFRQWLEAGSDAIPAPDVQILTSGGRKISAHSAVLAAASPVMESILDRAQKRGKSRRVIRILGVPDDAVMAFVRLIYSSGCMSLDEEEEMGRYGLHLLVLSHAYSVGWLKRACEVALALRLTAEGVVDVLLLARQCDAARLYLRCMKLLAKDFAAVKKTEAWQFLQANDPWLELEILQFLQEAELRKKRVGRKRAYRRVYEELGDAMECLQHMYMAREGSKKNHPCSSSACYRNLQLLIQHLAACPRRKACPRCCRMLQLLRLHSALCDDSTQQACRIPLCSHFKLRMQQQKEGKEEADTWQLLVKKVKVARVMSSFSKRKGQEGVHEQFALCTTTARTSD